MTAMNIATVFGPTLLRRRTEVAESMRTGCRVVQELLKVPTSLWDGVIANAQIPLVETPPDSALARTESMPRAGSKRIPSRQNSIQYVKNSLDVRVPGFAALSYSKDWHCSKGA